jgi:hypothetical protein
MQFQEQVADDGKEESDYAVYQDHLLSQIDVKEIVPSRKQDQQYAHVSEIFDVAAKNVLHSLLLVEEVVCLEAGIAIREVSAHSLTHFT